MVWTYLEKTFLPFTVSGFQRYLHDNSNFLVSHVEIRQHRIRPEPGILIVLSSEIIVIFQYIGSVKMAYG